MQTTYGAIHYTDITDLAAFRKRRKCEFWQGEEFFI